MADPGDLPFGPTNRPVPDAKLEFHSILLGVSFHPAMRLERKLGLRFAEVISDHIEISQTTLESVHWVLVGPEVEIKVTAQELTITAKKPQRGREWFEDRYLVLLNRFKELFSPRLILGSRALIRGLLPIDGDARNFVGLEILSLPPKKLRPLGRPLHLLGLRLFFPPFKAVIKDRETGEEEMVEEAYGINVKVESWMQDPRKLFLEADLKWPEPRDWDDENTNHAVEQLVLAENFLKNNLLKFLQQENNPTETEE